MKIISETKTKVTGRNSLIKLEYTDNKNDVHLQVYADTIVMEQNENSVYLVGCRFGGYPETVKAMTDAVYGGGSITLIMGDKDFTIHSHVKRYTRQLSNEGIYAESTMLLKDEDLNAVKEEGDSRPRRCYLFCEQNDSTHLFQQVDLKTGVPLIPEFQSYVLAELKARKILNQCSVISCSEQFDVWCLELASDERNIISAVEDGLRSGAIAIPGATDTPFPAVHSVSEYLNQFGVMIADRIKGQFNPLFDPATEPLSPEILAVNDNIMSRVGYALYDAQLALAESLKRRLAKSKFALCVGEPGSGKTKLGSTALHAYQQRYGGQHTKCFNVVICPSHIQLKWMREIDESLPNTWAAIVSNITEL